jgi:RHS repeat-associated protein
VLSPSHFPLAFSSTASTAWGYDALDRLTGETYTSSVSGQSYADTFSYDLVGNRLTKTHDAGSADESISYGYNHDDQLQTETGTLNGAAEYATAYLYDANGSLTSKTRTDTSVDPQLIVNGGAAQRSMVTSLQVVFDEAVALSSGALTLQGTNSSGITLTISNPSGDQKTYVVTFSGSTIIGGSLPDGNYSLLVAASGVHDVTGGAQTLAADQTLPFFRFFGDINGDRTVNGTDYRAFFQTYLQTSPSTGYNPAFDYNSDGTVNGTDDRKFFGNYLETLSVPAGGASAVVDTYTYDLKNQLASSMVNGVTTTYVTNANGDRVSETTGNVTTCSLVDDTNPTGYSQILEQNTSTSGAPATSYIIGDRVLGQATAGAPSYLISDGQGSTRLVTDASGSVTARYAYDAFGNAVGFTAGGAATSILYSGQQFDAGLSEYHLRARDYDPLTGTFTTFDSANNGNADPIDLHKYLYAGANPLNAWDPTGHFELAELQTVVGDTLDLASEINSVVQRVRSVANGISDVINIGQAIFSLLSNPAALFDTAFSQIATEFGSQFSFAYIQKLIEDAGASLISNLPTILEFNLRLDKLAETEQKLSKSTSTILVFLPLPVLGSSVRRTIIPTPLTIGSGSSQFPVSLFLAARGFNAYLLGQFTVLKRPPQKTHIGCFPARTR